VNEYIEERLKRDASDLLSFLTLAFFVTVVALIVP
jgi:hypothetical protein